MCEIGDMEGVSSSGMCHHVEVTGSSGMSQGRDVRDVFKRGAVSSKYGVSSRGMYVKMCKLWVQVRCVREGM